MGKGKGKKKDAAKKEALKERKLAKAGKKAARKAGKEAAANGGEEVDLQEAIRAFQMQKAEQLTEVVVTRVTQPTPRCYTNSVVTSNGDVAIFGGEWWDGRSTTMYGDMLLWSDKTKEWRTIDSPGSPPPRSSHQMVSVRDSIYLFGGEYSTTDQFYHYKDLWRFDVPTNLWEVIEAKGDSPSQRSGHRLALWRHYLVCFGGFYDVSREMKYYNDVHIFCLRERRWRRIPFSEHSSKPSPRSSACVALHNDTMYVYGGFAEVRVSTKTSRSQQLTDMWSLDLDCSKGKQGLDDVTGRWNKVGIRGIRPINRTSMTCAVFKKKKMIFFGGVSDASTSGMGSTAAEDDNAGIPHNDMYAFDMERKQFYMLGLRGERRKKKTKREERAEKKAAAMEKGDEEEKVEEEDEVEAAAGRGEKNKKRKKKKKDKKRKSKGDSEEEEEIEEEESADDDDDDDDDDEGVVNTMDDLQDDKFYYIVDGVLVEMTLDGDGEENGEEDDDEEEEEGKEEKEEADDGNNEDEGDEEKGENKKQREATTSVISPPSAPFLTVSPSLTTPASTDAKQKKEEEEEEEDEVRGESKTRTKPSSPQSASLSPSTSIQPKKAAPRPRFKASACIHSNTMYLYGGMWEEEGGRERLALDDLWSLDLSKLDEWTCLHSDSGIGEKKFQGIDERDDFVAGEEVEIHRGGGGGGSGQGGETKGGEYEVVVVEEEEEEQDELTEAELLAEYPPEVLVEMGPTQRLIAVTCKKIDLGMIKLGGGRRNRGGGVVVVVVVVDRAAVLTTFLNH